MRYVKVTWHHDFDDEPGLYYHEVGSDDYETRRVQVYRNGHSEWADENHQTDIAGLAEIPIESVEEIGSDGMTVLSAVTVADAPAWLRQLPAVELLRRIWVQQYQVTDGTVAWRDRKDLPPAAIRYCSPYDEQARTGVKRQGSGVVGPQGCELR